MKIINGYPPNWQKIKEYLNPPEDTVFAYGEIIYNPSNGKVWPDLEIHEETHQRQQERFGGVELWWDKYLFSKEFRAECEYEAYHNQYIFLKERITNKDLKTALTEMAMNLASNYRLNISYQEAEQRIRKYK